MFDFIKKFFKSPPSIPALEEDDDWVEQLDEEIYDEIIVADDDFDMDYDPESYLDTYPEWYTADPASRAKLSQDHSKLTKLEEKFRELILIADGVFDMKPPTEQKKKKKLQGRSIYDDWGITQDEMEVPVQKLEMTPLDIINMMANLSQYDANQYLQSKFGLKGTDAQELVRNIVAIDKNFISQQHFKEKQHQKNQKK